MFFISSLSRTQSPSWMVAMACRAFAASTASQRARSAFRQVHTASPTMTLRVIWPRGGRIQVQPDGVAPAVLTQAAEDQTGFESPEMATSRL
jgi:hypothetical protein